MKRRLSSRLNVYQNGDKVGALTRESSGAIYFQYDAEWLNNPDGTQVSLSLPLSETRYSGTEVMAVFDNLLPDSENVRQQIAERTHANGRDPYSLLEAIGRDCVGALQFLPDDQEPDAPGTVKARQLADSEIGALLRNLHHTPLGLSTNKDFRFSVAGAQEKTTLLFWKNRWHLPVGATATTHILKPQIGKLQSGLDLTRSVENEHLCMTLLKFLGLPVADTRIVDFDGVRALTVQRFDRWWKDKKALLRRPQEDCLQALGVPSSRKYESDGGPGITEVMQLLNSSETPLADQVLFMKTQICFWLIAATDGHAKNFSIFLGPGGRFALTPVYDVMSAQPLYTARQMTKKDMKLAMCFGRNRHYNIDTITRRHFYESAEMCNMASSRIDEIIEEIRSNWDSAVEQAVVQTQEYGASKMTEAIIDGAAQRLKVFAGSRR